MAHVSMVIFCYCPKNTLGTIRLFRLCKKAPTQQGFDNSFFGCVRKPQNSKDAITGKTLCDTKVSNLAFRAYRLEDSRMRTALSAV